MIRVEDRIVISVPDRFRVTGPEVRIRADRTPLIEFFRIALGVRRAVTAHHVEEEGIYGTGLQFLLINIGNHAFVIAFAIRTDGIAKRLRKRLDGFRVRSPLARSLITALVIHPKRLHAGALQDRGKRFLMIFFRL